MTFCNAMYQIRTHKIAYLSGISLSCILFPAWLSLALGKHGDTNINGIQSKNETDVLFQLICINVQYV